MSRSNPPRHRPMGTHKQSKRLLLLSILLVICTTFACLGLVCLMCGSSTNKQSGIVTVTVGHTKSFHHFSPPHGISRFRVTNSVDFAFRTASAQGQTTGYSRHRCNLRCRQPGRRGCAQRSGTCTNTGAISHQDRRECSKNSGIGSAGCS